jgi:hypothetical protein
VHGLREDHAQVDSTSTQLQAAISYPRDIQEIIDEMGHLSDLALYQSARRLVRGAVDRAGLQDMQGAANRAERVAQFMGNLRHDVVASLVLRAATGIAGSIAAMVRA